MIEHDQEFQTFFEPSQYAYKKRSLTVTALVEVLDSLQLAVDQKQYSVATFIDLLKASDIIDHHKLQARLTKYGLGKLRLIGSAHILLTDNNTSCLMVSSLNCVPV